jgi:hypothetical protein
VHLHLLVHLHLHLLVHLHLRITFSQLPLRHLSAQCTQLKEAALSCIPAAPPWSPVEPSL